MLTLRTVRIQSRLPKSCSGSLFDSERKCSACLRSCIVPPSRLHLNRQQSRPYLFIPLSWDEARERLERWLERAESRIVKVSLLKRRGKRRTLQTSEAQKNRRKPKFISKNQQWSHGKLTRWKRLRKNQLRPGNQLQSPFSLPLPSSQRPLPSLKMVEIRKVYQSWKTLRKSQYQLWKEKREEQYQGWKSRRQAQYQGWRARRQAQYQGWKFRRQAQYQRWNMKRVILEEYSQSEWFDALGRPLTARDSTGRFVNPWQSQSTNGIHSVGTILRWKWQRFVREYMVFSPYFLSPPMESDESDSCRTSSPLSTQTIPPLLVPKKSKLHFTWIGHSTCLFQVEKNFTILADPMFSTRASPFKNFIGVPRVVPPARSIPELVKHQEKNSSLGNNLGKIDLCCITHDHYDHMDTDSVKDLRHHVQLWVVPLGIGDWLVESCSIDRKMIIELEWWQQLRVGKKKGRVVVLPTEHYGENAFIGNERTDDEVLTITCCPSSHWAGRAMWDRNLIGDALGPFDLSCIPIGAYEPKEMNKDSHCNPLEAVKIHKDIRSKHSVAIHWGSFQLTEESMGDPPQELKDAICSEQEGQQHLSNSILQSPINFSILGHGETVVKDMRKSQAATNTPS